MRWAVVPLLASLACASSVDRGDRDTPTPTSSGSSTPTTPPDDPPTTPDVPPVEVCNGVDDDGDGLVDDDDPDLDPSSRTRFFRDADRDGFGDPAVAHDACAPPPGAVLDGSDCDDTRPTVFPGAPPACDGHRDTDCDGLDDPEEVDADGDGYTPCAGDCDDTDAAARPGVRERCDGRDTNCDGVVDGDDPDAEPSSCGWCPDPLLYPETALHIEWWNPCLLDPDVTGLCYLNPEVDPDTHRHGRRLHRVYWRDDVPQRDQLFVYLPPGDTADTVTIPKIAAFSGFRSISLGYVNNVSLRTACGYEHPSPRSCYGEARHELLFGEDRNDVYDVGPADAAEERLAVLLAHLDRVHPGERWGQWLTPDGSVRWDDVVVAGWSAGSGNAGYLAAQRQLSGLVMFSGPQDLFDPGDGDPDLADWILEPRATPDCVEFGAYHRLDSITLLSESWDALGLPPGEADLDVEDPPYGGLHRLTAGQLSDGCDPHQSMGRDGCIRPETVAGYVHLFCTAAERDPDGC